MVEDIFAQMTDEEIQEWFEGYEADIYCCSPECLELPYLDAGL